MLEVSNLAADAWASSSEAPQKQDLQQETTVGKRAKIKWIIETQKIIATPGVCGVIHEVPVIIFIKFTI